MKKNNYILGISILMIVMLSSCNTGLLIGETKVPYKKICGSLSEYECRANGIGPKGLQTYRTFKKERPQGSGKSVGHNYYNLGRSMDIISFNNPGSIAISLEENEVEIDTVKIDYDLKKENVNDILAELNSSLKKEKISSEVSAQIKNDFKRELNNNLKIEAYIITYTIKANVLDGIRFAQSGGTITGRYVNVVNIIKNNKYPIVRQVKIIKEICSFSENKNLSNLLEAVLKAKLGEGDTKADGILNTTLSKKKTFAFKSSFQLTSIYSYGFWNDHWMN